MTKFKRVMEVRAMMRMYNVTIQDLQKVENGEWLPEPKEEYEVLDENCDCEPTCKAGTCEGKNLPYDMWW
jgi:hypothetical protein